MEDQQMVALYPSLHQAKAKGYLSETPYRCPPRILGPPKHRLFGDLVCRKSAARLPSGQYQQRAGTNKTGPTLRSRHFGRISRRRQRDSAKAHLLGRTQALQKERKQMMTGKTVIQIIVETDGHVRDAHVIKSIVGPTANKDDETVPMLDQKALDAVSEYRFEPATLQGKPVPVLVNVEVNFQVY
jgi:TonB family protein